MRKLLNKIKNHILLATIVFTLLFALLCALLSLCNIMFRKWVYYLVALLVACGIIFGIIQTRGNAKNKIFKIFMNVVLILGVIGIILSSFFIFIALAFSYTPEHIIEKNDKKYVAYVHSFLKVDVYYYDYINFFIMGNKVKIREYYGSGGYDPFDGEHDSCQPSTSYYYDDDGRVIDTNVKDYSKNNSSTENVQIPIENGNNNVNQSAQTINRYWINELIGYKVDIVDSAMGYEGIKIYRTTDAGNSWKSQLTSEYEILSVHYNSQFLFLNDNLAFIYDPGRAGAENEKGKLMVSTNNSKTYIPCVVELPITLNTNTIYIDGLPTYENNNLKLKVYSIDYQNGPIKTYYNYTSKDGITWLYDSKAE